MHNVLRAIMNKDNLHIDIENNIKGLQSNNDRTREKYFKIIYPLSDSNPELFYPYWDIKIGRASCRERV